MASFAAPIAAAERVTDPSDSPHAGRRIDLPNPALGRGNDPVPPRITTACQLYRSGHNVHIIQSIHALQTKSVRYTLIAVEDHELVVRDELGATSRWWVHDTGFAAAALLLEASPTVHLHELGLARIGSTQFYPHAEQRTARTECATSSDLARASSKQ